MRGDEERNERSEELPPNPTPLPRHMRLRATGRTSGARPGYPASGGQRAEKQGPTGRTSGDKPGYPACGGQGAKCSGPGCPAEEPDVRPLDRRAGQGKDVKGANKYNLI